MEDSFDANAFDLLSFDCYGTLIDWETGILNALRALLGVAADGVADDALLVLYARFETAAERGAYRPYRDVLARVADDIAAELGVTLAPGSRDRLPDSVGHWQPFPDTVDALHRLSSRFRLAIISNVDDALFAQTAKRLGVTFDEIVTAQQVGAYKPAPRVFETARVRFGVAPGRWLHVAQSLVHDVVPANTLGINSVWVDRRGGRGGGAAGVPEGAPRPDLIVPDLATLADQAGV
jgi:2-haloacid dehalogenase